jgi:hypothetical protein
MSNWLIDSFIAVNENSASIGVIEAEIFNVQSSGDIQ